jgi:hypothetical protein
MQLGFGHFTSVAFDGLLQGRRRLARRREQGFDEPTGVPFIKTDELTLANSHVLIFACNEAAIKVFQRGNSKIYAAFLRAHW